MVELNSMLCIVFFSYFLVVVTLLCPRTLVYALKEFKKNGRERKTLKIIFFGFSTVHVLSVVHQ